MVRHGGALLAGRRGSGGRVVPFANGIRQEAGLPGAVIGGIVPFCAETADGAEGGIAELCEVFGTLRVVWLSLRPWRVIHAAAVFPSPLSLRILIAATQPAQAVGGELRE